MLYDLTKIALGIFLMYQLFLFSSTLCIVLLVLWFFGVI